MKTNLLLNQSGFIPDFTSKRPRPDSVSSPCRCRVLAILLLCLTLGIGQMWGAVGDAITAHGSIADATVYYLAGQATVSSKTNTYYSVLASDAASASVTGNATTTRSDGTKYTFLIESGTYYLVTPNGYYVEPHGSSNGKLILTAAAKAVTVSTVSSKIRITGTTNTGKSIQKNKTTNANFGSYGNTQNDLTLYVAGYRVIYDKNGATGGTVPTDATVYGDNATATIKANTGSLVKTGYTFAGWNTAANGSGTDVAASGSATRTITAGLRLYAKWTAAASCSADPTIGAASLNGSFNSGGVTSLTNTVSFSTTSCDPKTNCEWQDYGFVWGTSASPTVSNTKMQKGTDGDATSWDMTSPSTFTVDNTYKVRAYGKNGKTGAAFVYSASDLSFTPRSVAFNSNGGSAVATKYIRSGGTITNPGAPATPKTGYTFDSWRTDAGLGTAVNWSSAINSSTTYYAKWNPNNYTIMLNDGVGSGGSGSVTATFDANTNLTSNVDVPTRTDYIFGGYWTGDNGTGTQIIDANGAFIASAGGGSTYTDASKNWKYANDITLKAKWTEHTYTNYRTKCCTDLGAIDGEATLTQGGNSVTISGWSDVANVGTYTVKLYKKNGASWDLVSGSASGGSAGAQGTRTGITSGSKSVTYTGLVVESEYKFTIQAIAGSAAYCDGVETAITEINSTDVSSTPFKFRYSIYIDNGSNSGWAHHYIEPTGNTDEGSVSITLGAHVDYYQFKIAGGFSGWWGQSGSSKIPANTQWTLNSDQNVRLETGAGGTYVFTVDYSGTTNPKVTVTFPSADQKSGYKIYFDKSVIAGWGSTLKYRIGNGSHNQNQDFTLVPGTDNFYVTTTPSYGSMDAWQIANNVAWSGSNSIYNYYHGDGNDITRATVYQDYAVDEDITIVPTSKHNTENYCDFWDVSKTSGMLTHTATITTPSHGTINIAYTDVSGTSQPTNTSTVADLAHRTILTITATPATGYTCTSLTVNGAAFTSGSTHILAADATIAATFTAQTSTVTLDNNNATSGSQQTVTATYDATMPLVTTADGTPAVAALTRTGYTFNGWWDAPSGGNQYYTYSGSPKVIASARTWDKTGAQTLKAQWIVNQYTLTWDLQGGTVATAGTGAAAAATGTPSSSQDYGTALKAPVVTKTGYNFNVWSPSVASTMPAENTTYTASWTAQEYNITYKDQGDNAYSGNVTAGVPTGAPTTHTYGAATDLVDGVRSGYRFDGWFTDASCTISAGSSIGATAKTADFTLYAKWTPIYTVTWHVNGSTYNTGVVAGNSAVVSGGKISAVPTAPADNTLSCATKFMGWSASPIAAGTKVNGAANITALGLFTTVGGSPAITDDTDFYAVFASQTNSNGYKYIGDAGTLSDGEKYIFVDAKTAGSAHALKASDLAENSSSGKTGTAVGVTITSTAEGVLITTVNTDLEFEYASTGTKLKYTDGLTTKYLFINGNGVGYKTDDSRSAYGTHQLYGWTNKSVNRYVYYNSTNFTISEDAQNMYAFIKQTPVYGDYMEQCDANMVNVTYDANGGSTTCANTTTDKREDYDVCATEPTRDYYTFAGWLCSADDEVYAANATIDDAVIDANFTLTAQWTPVSYTITYNYNGGSPQVSPTPASSYTVESSEITLQTPTKGHDRFEGWYENADLTTGGVKTTIPAGSHENKTYYAKWATRHEIIFDADGTKTTIYRAEDEALNASIAGQGSIPVNPSAPSACSSKVFVGWIAEEIEDETDDEPTFVDLSSTVNANKHYYAVWATSVGNAIAAVEDATFTGGEYESYFSKTYGLKANDKYVYKNSIWTSSDMTAGTKVRIKVKHLSNSSAATLTIALINSSGTVVTSTTLTTTANSSDISNAAYSSNVELTATTAVTGYKITLSNKGSSSGVVILAATREVVATRSAYSTSCCATKVTLSHNSPSNGTVAFGKTTVPTCDEDKDVSLTITPAAGYQLSSYEVATGSGKVAAKSVSPAIALNNNSSAAQNITLTFAEDANGAYDVTAAFSLMTVTSWTWTMHDGGGAIPDPLNLYVGQSARLDVAYTPSTVVAGKKTYTRDKDNTYINWVGGLQSGYSTISGRTSTGENTTAVTFTHADGPTKTVNVKVLPLPLTHFADLVHGKAFADVAATIVDNALSATKTTPTSDDWTTPNANTCEENHLHLVGWIREDWPALVAYLNGTGDAPTTTAIVGAGNDGSGNAYFFAPNASINVQTFDGVTFYAVWSKVE